MATFIAILLGPMVAGCDRGIMRLPVPRIVAVPVYCARWDAAAGAVHSVSPPADALLRINWNPFSEKGPI